MGLEIDREEFVDGDYARFDQRVAACLDALRAVLARPGFGHGPTTLGAELELHLVDGQGRPAPVNRRVLAETHDRRVTLEVDRFNLEINADPVPLEGQPFTAMAAALESALAETRRAAAAHRARVVPIGILPTLTRADLGASALTDSPRYRALSAGIRRLRRAPEIPLRIGGQDTLDLETDDVTYEGASTSFQVHLRAAPEDFATLYNAAQLATAPVLAVAGNSPLFLGCRLWEETRVALFRQAVEDRAGADAEDWRPSRVSFGHGWVRSGAYELFAESVALHEPLLPVVGSEDPMAEVGAGRTPSLAEMKLHHGTVWRWNRAVYDHADGGHLRIELRTLPAGPTVADMVANAAFLIGLVRGLAPFVDRMLHGVTFGHARRNFYAAARYGLDAELLWPDEPGTRVRPVCAAELAQRLLPLARDGLVDGGTDAAEADRWLGIIRRRIETGRTGARWQRATFEALRRSGATSDEASVTLVERYLHAVGTGALVHDWPVSS